jgi:sterol desaturase/sphingolipid hydroxylase (fatty acid hydroxylase superfamily)
MNLFYFSLSVFFILGSLLEFYLTRKEMSNYYDVKDFKSSLFLMFGGLFFDLIIKIPAIYLLIKLYDYSIFPMGYKWWTWILCYVFWDLIIYIEHYLEHNVRFMWAIHVNHHSSPHMNLSTALRSGVFKAGYRYFFWIIPIAIGFPVPMFLVVYGIGKIWAFFSHSQRLGDWKILEKFTITPSHHIIHHSYNEQNLNKNFGETFLFWDKLFGTFKQTNDPLLFGINESVDPTNYKEVVFHEFDNMKRDLSQTTKWSKKLQIIFGKPI